MRQRSYLHKNNTSQRQQFAKRNANTRNNGYDVDVGNNGNDLGSVNQIILITVMIVIIENIIIVVGGGVNNN